MQNTVGTSLETVSRGWTWRLQKQRNEIRVSFMSLSAPFERTSVRRLRLHKKDPDKLCRVRCKISMIPNETALTSSWPLCVLRFYSWKEQMRFTPQCPAQRRAPSQPRFFSENCRAENLQLFFWLSGLRTKYWSFSVWGWFNQKFITVSENNTPSQEYFCRSSRSLTNEQPPRKSHQMFGDHHKRQRPICDGFGPTLHNTTLRFVLAPQGYPP